MNIRTTVFAAATLALSNLLPAQDLHAEVTRDPNAGLAIYDFQIGAPPGSSAFLLAAFDLLPSPLQIPGVFGLIEIDAFHAMVLLPPIPVGPVGGQGQFTIPSNLLDGVELGFQAVVIDPNQQLAIAPMAAAAQGVAPVAAPPQIEWSGSYNRNPDTYTMKLLRGRPGANVRILINGGQKAIGMVVLDAQGNGTVRIPVTLAKGDGITIEVDGRPVRSWTWF